MASYGPPPPVTPGDKAANLAKIEANVREAAAQGVNIGAFPEEALIGCGGCDVCSTGAAHPATKIRRTAPNPEFVALYGRLDMITPLSG